jgi:hypothetical protein
MKGLNRHAIYALTCALVFVLSSPLHLSAQAAAARPWEQIPIPALHAFKPHQPQRIELNNGIVLFLQEDHELPFISGSVLIPGGARDEDPAKTGLVDLYGQTWRTSGTEKMSGDAMDDLLRRRGFDRLVMEFAQRRLRPGVRIGDGPSLSSQIQCGKTGTGQTAGCDGHRPAQ